MRYIYFYLVFVLTLGPCAAAEIWKEVPYADGKNVSVLIQQSTLPQPVGVLVVFGWGPGKRSEVAACIGQYWQGAPNLGWHIVGIAAGEVNAYINKGPKIVEGVLTSLKKDLGEDSLPIVVAGSAAGGHIALAALAEHPKHYIGAIALPGFGFPLNNLAGKRVALRVGALDSLDWVKGVEQSADRFEQAGADVNYGQVDGQGQLPQLNALELLTWVAAGHAKDDE